MGNYTEVDNVDVNALDTSTSEINRLRYDLADYKILVVNDHLPNTGVGKATFNTFDLAKKYGINTDMLLTNQDSEYDGDGVITQLSPKPLRKIKKHGTLFELLSYYHFPSKAPKGYSLYHISSQMMGRYCDTVDPTVLTCCDSIAFRVDGNHELVSQHLLRKHFDHIPKARKIIFFSDHARDDFLSLFDYPVDDTRVIYLGVDRDTFVPGNKESERDDLGLPQEIPIILNVGSENPRKNMKTLMQSVYRLKRNIPNISLIRIGQKSPETAAIIGNLGIEDNVIYIDSLTEDKLASYYRAADVFVFPSYYEGFGMPLLEAFASELPVVSSNATSLPEVAGDAVVLNDPFDVETMSENIENVLSNNQLCEELIKKGNRRADNFSWERTTKETLELYRDALAV